MAVGCGTTFYLVQSVSFANPPSQLSCRPEAFLALASALMYFPQKDAGLAGRINSFAGAGPPVEREGHT
jgi:hypothetical protein